MNINWKWMLVGVIVGIGIAIAIVQKGSNQLKTALKLA